MPGPWLQGLPFHPQGSLRIRLSIQRSYLGPGQPRGHSWDLMGTGKRLPGRQRRGSSEGGRPGQWWGVILKPGAPTAEHPASLRDPPDEPQAPPTPDSIRMKIPKDQDWGIDWFLLESLKLAAQHWRGYPRRGPERLQAVPLQLVSPCWVELLMLMRVKPWNGEEAAAAAAKSL